MKNIFNIDDITINDINDTKYEVGIFFIGYEERSTLLTSIINENLIKSVLIIHIQTDKFSRADAEKKIHGIFCQDKVTFLSVENPKELHFATTLAHFLLERAQSGNLLIDYSSMPRQIYCDILNVCLFLRGTHSIRLSLDFFYAHGDHDSFSTAGVIGDIYCLRGCEANISSYDRTVALVGLGFDDGTPMHILDSIEPNEIFCFYASPAAVDGYDLRALSRNQGLIHLSAVREKNVVPAPINSVSGSYKALFEVISPCLNNSNITILPFGPKPHILASIILSMTSARVSCLYADRKATSFRSVPATGETTCTRIST